MRQLFLIATACVPMLSGCSAVPEDKQAAEPTETALPSATATIMPPSMAAPTSIADQDMPPERSPQAPTMAPVASPEVSLTPSSAKGEAGARAVLETWAGALEDHDYDLAWEQFLHPPSGRNGFAKWWSRYDTIEARVGRGTADAGAGSLYYTVPVTLIGLTADGRRYRLQGPVVLRRVNDVDGATPEQLRWHIESAELKDVTAD